MSIGKNEIENLSRLITSANDKNISVAFEIIKGFDDPELLKSLLSEFYALYKIHKESHMSSKIPQIPWDHVKKIEMFLNTYGDEQVKAAMKSRLSVVVGYKMAANLKKLTKNNILDAKKIATVIFNRCGFGLGYLCSELDDATLSPILKQFKKEEQVCLAHKRLKKLPSLIFEWEDVTDLNLNYNQITSLPKGLVKLKNLKHLFLRDNYMKKISHVVTKLPNLKYIDVASVNGLTMEEKNIIDRIEGLQVNFAINPKLPQVPAPYF